MAYLNEVKFLNQNNRKPPSYLQAFHENRKSWFRQVLLPYCKDYCAVSSIHCMRYLTDSKMRKYEKIIWLLIIAATTICTIYVYFELSALYFTKRIQTTVEDSVYPIFFITFPSIAICTRNRVNWPKLQNAHERFLPTNASEESIYAFRHFFETLEDFRFGNFALLQPIFNSTDSKKVQLSLIDGVNVLDVMKYLSFTCEEVFDVRCYWRNKVYNCCELFTLERTEAGLCHVFNSVVTEKAQERAKKEKYYPYHNSKAGESSGLEVDVILDETKMRPGLETTNGVYAMIKQPEQWSDDIRFIKYNTYTKISVTAQLTDTDERTRSLSPVERNCLFADEHDHPLYKNLPRLRYWRGNCLTRCHQEYIIKYCNCNLQLLFPNDISTDCKPSDFKCIYNNEKIFGAGHHESEGEYFNDVSNESMICNCMNSCDQLMFVNNFNSVPLEGVKPMDAKKKIHLDVHYHTEHILKYSTHMRFSFVELLANFGGIIGLFLGASLLSAVEIVYFFTVGFYTHLQKEYDSNHKHQLTTVKVINVKFPQTPSDLKYKLQERGKY